MEKPKGRPKKSGQLRTVTFNLRITEDDRELVRLLTADMQEPSDTQTVIRIIREKAKDRGIVKGN